MKDMHEYILGLCKAAKAASYSIADASGMKKNNALRAIADILIKNKEEIINANKLDIGSAEQNGVRPAMVDRLMLDGDRIDGIASALNELCGLADPIGTGNRWNRPNGLEISRVRVPLGVIAIIYEARPNVTVDAAALCLKTGNAVVLRGGKEAINTNRILVKLMREAIESAGICGDAVQLVDDTSREGTNELLCMRGYIDALIPRGGKGLIRSVVENARVPVIETGSGNCHLYVDASADIDMAVNIAVNAKTSRPSVCNAIETLLVHRDAAGEFLPRFAEAAAPFHVELRGDAECRSIIKCDRGATEEDYETEYDDYILAIHVVGSTQEAIEHIAKYSTGHSEAIITRSLTDAELFKRRVNSAAVYVNASTRFTDGGEFGFGAEIGISTQKLHARGPMGLTELTTVKYLIDGDGQIR